MKLFRLSIAAACFVFSAACLHANATHIWVSTTGNDTTGTGTIAKPFLTFAKAVLYVSPGGELSVMDPGDYGPFTITQSITVDGTGGGGLTFAGNAGITINASSAASVTLRNLSIVGADTGLNGISIGSNAALALMIDGCQIAGFNQVGVELSIAANTYLTIRNSWIQGGETGIETYNLNGSVANARVQLNHVDLQNSSLEGVLASNGNIDILDSTITGSAVGVEASAGATLNVEHSMISSNGTGVCVMTSSSAVIGTTATVTDNTTNVGSCGGTVNGSAGASPAPKL